MHNYCWCTSGSVNQKCHNALSPQLAERYGQSLSSPERCIGQRLLSVGSVHVCTDPREQSSLRESHPLYIPCMYAPILESNHPGERFACSQCVYICIHSVMFRLKMHFVETLECTLRFVFTSNVWEPRPLIGTGCYFKTRGPGSRIVCKAYKAYCHLLCLSL